MPYLIGTDEAGYGPNYGPLVISASRWRLSEGVLGDALYARLAPTVVAQAKRCKLADGQFAIADSKTLYSPDRGLALLEHGLWIIWGMLGKQPATVEEVWDLLASGSRCARHEAFCGHNDPQSAPLVARPVEIEAALPLVRQAFLAADVCVEALSSRAIFPAEFNEAVAASGSKGASLSRWTLQLIKDILPAEVDDAVFVFCDKHGGRDRYMPILMEAFPGIFVKIIEEAGRRSVYRFRLQGQPVEIVFEAKGEAHMPIALASMASKYLRELAMFVFNQFWQKAIPGLKPTAGYPRDALRFRDAIAKAQRKLCIDERILWRIK